MSKTAILIFVAVLVLLGLLGRFVLPDDPTPFTQLTGGEENKITSAVVEDSFKELTVLYLRDKKYSSSLSGMEKESDNPKYTTYLTSYLSDGYRINGLLAVPAGKAPPNGWPAIVFVHGFIPPKEYQTTEKYGDYVDYLARNGFVVFKIDLRGHGQSEGEAGGGYFSSDYVVDTLNAYSALTNTDFINPKRVGLWGHSMAGNIVLRSMAVKPSIPAAVIWAGAVYTYEDIREYSIADSSYTPSLVPTERHKKRDELFVQYGTPSAQSPFWREVAPTNYLSDLKGAISLHHAQDDAVVSIEYSRNLIKLLDKTKVPHTFYEYKTGGHNISEPSFSVAMERTVAFFNTYLR